MSLSDNAVLTVPGGSDDCAASAGSGTCTVAPGALGSSQLTGTGDGTASVTASWQEQDAELQFTVGGNPAYLFRPLARPGSY